MVEAGLTVVRIGEFAWSRMEPAPGKFEWDWLDLAIKILGEAGLQVVLGTPTATPPRWMLDKHPDMLAVDAEGKVRKFGSRRHYCFSHAAYRDESVRIASLMAQRYGKSPYLTAWQIDNEYGCHDTVLSYSDAARSEFRNWLPAKYPSIDALNSAWGNVFWSMEYDSFAQVDLPNLTVTEANPAHCLDFRRFSSDQVMVYNRAQADAIRSHSSVPLLHNYMGRIVDFDHYRLAEDLEIASWDSYPLGFLEDRAGADDDWKLRFYRQGDPDFQAFHHDLYRAVGRGRWWVMEQQPGPVNWAPHNPAPLPGMVRMWTWEAIAHQAEAVCYFRWRQAPFAQEQMHAGLLRPDGKNASTFSEIKQVAREVAQIEDLRPGRAEVALVFDYESCWAWQVQPQGEDFDYFKLALDFYKGLRRLGLSIDILPPGTAQLEEYKAVLIPGLMHWPVSLLSALQNYSGVALIGPRSGSKTADFAIPPGLPPGLPMLDCRVSYIESLRCGATRALSKGGAIHCWLESLEGDAPVIETLIDGSAALVGSDRLQYLAGWPEPIALRRILMRLCSNAGIQSTDMPEGVRARANGSHRFLFNYNSQPANFEGQTLEPAAVRWQNIG